MAESPITTYPLGVKRLALLSKAASRQSGGVARKRAPSTAYIHHNTKTMRVQNLLGYSKESDRLVVSVPVHRYQEFLSLTASNNALVIEMGYFYETITFHVLDGKALAKYISKLNKAENQYNPDYRSEFPPLDVSVDSQQRFYELLPKLIRKQHRDYDRKAIGFNF